MVYETKTPYGETDFLSKTFGDRNLLSVHTHTHTHTNTRHGFVNLPSR